MVSIRVWCRRGTINTVKRTNNTKTYFKKHKGGGGRSGGARARGGGAAVGAAAVTEVAKLSVLLLCSRSGYQHLVFAYRLID